MTRAAAWGMTPTSPCALASARSKSSIACTNARAPERAGHDRLDRIAPVGVGRDATVAVRPSVLAARGDRAGRVRLPGLDESIEDGRAGAVEHASRQRDAFAVTWEQDLAAVAPEQLAREERADRLRGR